MVVVAIDSNQIGAVDLGVQNLGRLQIRGHQDVGLQSKAGSMGSHRIGQVSGRGAAHRIKAKVLRRGKGNRDDAIFEAQRGQATASFLT